MQTAHGSDAPSPPERSGWVRAASEIRPRLSIVRFARSRTDALLSGVAGGLGARWGVEPVIVRIAFVVLSFAAAVGVLLYLAAWAVSLDPDDPRAPRPREPSAQQAVAFGLVILGTLMLLRGAGLWFGDAVGVPLVIAAVGAGVIYVGTSAEGRPSWARFGLGGRTLAGGRPSVVRLVVGALLVVGGMAWFLTTNPGIEGFLGVLLAVTVTTAGIGIVFGPWVYRLANQLGTEHRERIRSQERAELAAHLHDSVLQTLALIQRNAADPRKMASLARRQERELRTWLYGTPEASDRLATAMEPMAAAIEEAHEVAVDLVVVGDCPLDERAAAVLHACREAATNAAVHSGEAEISVYVECEQTIINAYVRDRGKGFAPDELQTHRRGIADSIRGRIERNGGAVTITSAPGEGCEVHIAMPRAFQEDS